MNIKAWAIDLEKGSGKRVSHWRWAVTSPLAPVTSGRPYGSRVLESKIGLVTSNFWYMYEILDIDENKN